jgi:toxin HigB-1
VIKSFRHKGLANLWATGKSAEVPAELRARCLRVLQVVNVAKTLNEIPANYNPHPLMGQNAGRYAMRVSGPWRITFEWREPDAWAADLEQYH